MEGQFPMLLHEDGAAFTHSEIDDLVDIVTTCRHQGRCNLRTVFVNGCGTICGNVLGQRLYEAGVPCVVYWEDRVVPDVASEFAHAFFRSCFADWRGERYAFDIALTLAGIDFGVSADEWEIVGACSGIVKSTNNRAGGRPK